jgi:4'-phosphopantetheinyl transferase EntD
VIGALFPAGVVAAEVIGDDLNATLLPEEEAALGQVIEQRRRQFTLGRACARRALVELGLLPTPVLRGPKREPRWPAGVVGSITHCRGYAAAAVASQADFAALGVDAEEDGPLPRGVLRLVATEEERAWLAEVAVAGLPWDRVLFSAKESVFKAWYPLAGRWLGFQDAVVTFDPGRGTFRARLLVEGPRLDGRVLGSFDGGYLVTGGFVLTAVTVPAT